MYLSADLLPIEVLNNSAASPGAFGKAFAPLFGGPGGSLPDKLQTPAAMAYLRSRIQALGAPAFTGAQSAAVNAALALGMFRSA